MSSYYSHLGLTDWPFSIVPRPEHSTFLAGRDALRTDVSHLLRALSRRDTSSINVLWSWFGAGKTHALLYLASQARTLNGSNPSVLIEPVYTEIPKSAKSFIDLYRTLASRMDFRRLSDDYLEVTTSRSAESFVDLIESTIPDLASALRAMVIREGLPKTIANRWLRADNVPLPDLRSIGVSQRITNTDHAVQVLSVLVKISHRASENRGQQGHRLLWLVDEFQRIAKTRGNAVADINAGLHSLFNACPTGLSIVLSFSGPPDENRLPGWFSPELRDRIGATRALVLPPLHPAQAESFVQEIIAHFRDPNVGISSAYFPFSRESCRAIISFLSERTTLLPRTIMHAFNAVLESADPLIENGELAEITAEFSRKVLADYVIVADAPDD